MTDMVRMTEYILNDTESLENSSPHAISVFLNRNPFSYFGMESRKCAPKKRNLGLLTGEIRIADDFNAPALTSMSSLPMETKFAPWNRDH